MSYLIKKSSDFACHDIEYWIGHHFSAGNERVELAQLEAAYAVWHQLPGGMDAVEQWEAIVDGVSRVVGWAIEPVGLSVAPEEIRDAIYKFFSSQDEKIEDVILNEALSSLREGLAWDKICERVIDAEKAMRISLQAG